MDEQPAVHRRLARTVDVRHAYDAASGATTFVVTLDDGRSRTFDTLVQVVGYLHDHHQGTATVAEPRPDTATA